MKQKYDINNLYFASIKKQLSLIDQYKVTCFGKRIYKEEYNYYTLVYKIDNNYIDLLYPKRKINKYLAYNKTGFLIEFKNKVLDYYDDNSLDNFISRKQALIILKEKYTEFDKNHLHSHHTLLL